MERPELDELIKVVAQLRDPQNGCPWDLKQTHESLLRYLFEESYEFKNAVMQKNELEMEEELGDILLQVLLHGQIASDRGAFNLESVAAKLKKKLVHRHPHVFASEGEKLSSEEVEKRWQALKQKEKPTAQTRALSSRVLNNTALGSANEIGKKTGQLNFDWEDASQVLYKVEEEWQELKEEIVPGVEVNQARIQEELGDFLFSTVQLARHLGVDSEEALRRANEKFVRRFQQVEDLLRQENLNFTELNQQQLDVYWNQVKYNEKKK